jgi:WD40 repeat protein/serine/threonine protein kinase
MDSPDDIFLNAREIADRAERAAYLAQACGANTALRKRVEALLRDAAGARDFFGAEGKLPGMVAAPLTEGLGTVIGRYKLLQKIGEGGMGVVYMAEQREPVVRKVALKIIKLGMDTRQVLGRFEAERQALALMDHPNIAKILDGGATGTGRPYFVMDLVQGLPITRFSDEANLSTRDRLDLFLEVCSAIQHAHQKGIIHRDIKPANILVTLHGDKTVPKVIDFGIAKAMQGRLTEKTLFTQFQHFIGTPAYMSPEQASLSGLDVDTRSDIYGLGVLLYELLTGKTPFDEKELMKAGFDEMRRIIRETEPPKPSTRLTRERLATRSATSAKSEIRNPKSEIDKDLDWIVMKCLEKDRARRYETANGLAADLKRHLANEPVIARPPSQLYRFQKLARRNRLAFAAIAAITAVLLLAVVVSTWQAVRATRAEQEQSRLRESEAKQRQQAEANEQKAQAAQANETQLRRQSERRAYASDMNLAQRAVEMNNIGAALNLLNRYRPTDKSEIRNPKSEKDLRGWEWRYLWSQCQSEADSVFCRTTAAIKSLAVSHDGAWLATGLSETGVSVWDLATGQEIARLPASGFIVHVAFSPRETLLAYSDVPNLGSSSTNHSIHLWNGATRQIVRTLPMGHQSYGADGRGAVYGVAFSGDGRTLVTSTQNPDNLITLWRVSDGKKLVSYPAPQMGPGVGTPFALARDLSVAAHQTEDNKVRVIDLNTGQERWQRKATDEYVLALALSPDGKFLASGAGFADAVIRLWDVASGSELGRLEGHRSGIHQLMFWPDGKSLASASFDQTIRLWDVTDPAKGRPLNILRGHEDYVRGIALLPPDNTTLVSGSQDGTVCLWNTAATGEKRKLLTLPIPVGLWCFAPDSKSVVTAENHDGVGHVARWSQETDFQAMQPLFDVGTNIHEGCFSGDGRWLAVSYANGDVRVWDLQSHRQPCEFTAHTRPVIPQAFTPGGRKLMLVHPEDNSLHEWDLTTRQETRSWPPAVGRYTGAFSPDGKWYLTSILNPDTKTVTSLVELSSGRETNLNLGWYYAASFSANGRLFALGGWGENAVRLFETANAKEVAKLSGIRGQLFGLGFSPDATRFMICYGGHEGSQEIVTLHDMESDEKLLSLEGGGSLFDAVAFSPDGNVLAASNWRGLLHLWRAPSWAEIEAAEKVQTK